jgi:hypothetical protein
MTYPDFDVFWTLPFDTTPQIHLQSPPLDGSLASSQLSSLYANFYKRNTPARYTALDSRLGGGGGHCSVSLHAIWEYATRLCSWQGRLRHSRTPRLILPCLTTQVPPTPHVGWSWLAYLQLHRPVTSRLKLSDGGVALELLFSSP